jgi:hypothetical protein
MKITHTLFTTLIVSAIALSFTTARALEDHKEPVDATNCVKLNSGKYDELQGYSLSSHYCDHSP